MLSDLMAYLISDFGIALNHTINSNLVTIFLVWFSMGAIPKFDIKSVISNLILYLISAKKQLHGSGIM